MYDKKLLKTVCPSTLEMVCGTYQDPERYLMLFPGLPSFSHIYDALQRELNKRDAENRKKLLYTLFCFAIENSSSKLCSDINFNINSPKHNIFNSPWLQGFVIICSLMHDEKINLEEISDEFSQTLKNKLKLEKLIPLFGILHYYGKQLDLFPKNLHAEIENYKKDLEQLKISTSKNYLKSLLIAIIATSVIFPLLIAICGLGLAPELLLPIFPILAEALYMNITGAMLLIAMHVVPIIMGGFWVVVCSNYDKMKTLEPNTSIFPFFVKQSAVISEKSLAVIPAEPLPVIPAKAGIHF
jgi:hypothetical protein